MRSGVLSCTMFVDSTLSQPRVGYVLGRAYGSAVSRNRLRRQMREILRTREAALQPGVYVFGASPRAKGLAHSDLVVNVDRLLQKIAERGRP